MDSINNAYYDYCEEWGSMTPSEWEDLGVEYVNKYGGENLVLAAGVLIDSEALVPGSSNYTSLPVFLAIPYATTSWTSNYKVRAWENDEVPDLVWEYVDAVSEELSEDEYHELMKQYESELLEM